jgi:hypothetical protein
MHGHVAQGREPESQGHYQSHGSFKNFLEDSSFRIFLNSAGFCFYETILGLCQEHWALLALLEGVVIYRE